MILIEKFIKEFNILCDDSKEEKIEKDDKTLSKFHSLNKTIRRKPDDINKKMNNNIDNNCAFDEIFKYKQFYLNDEKFLNKNDFLKKKNNDYNLLSKDNIFSVNQIIQDQSDINKNPQENKVTKIFYKESH